MLKQLILLQLKASALALEHVPITLELAECGLSCLAKAKLLTFCGRLGPIRTVQIMNCEFIVHFVTLLVGWPIRY